MWSPTHVQVLVRRAKGLNVKGKGGTNDAFVTIGLGKERFQTSVKEKATDPVEWNEQCELRIPSHGNTAEVTLTLLHRNFLGVDEFLGQAVLPLNQFDVYERPKSRWCPLKCKPGKNKTDYRGEIEVKVGFTVKATTTSDSVGGSVADLVKKNKGSVSSINKVAGTIGGSLMSLGSKEKKSIKKIAKSVSHKVEKVGDKAKKSVGSTLKLNKGSRAGGLESLPETRQWDTLYRMENQEKGNLDPGVNSDEEGGEEDEEFRLEDAVSHHSSASSVQSRGFSEQEGGRSRGDSGRQFSRNSSGRSSSGVKRRHGLPKSATMAGLSFSERTKPSQDNPVTPGQEEFTAKLMGKRALVQPSRLENLQSQNKKGSQSSLPSYNEATKIGREPKTSHTTEKKLIIPVHSDSESSPSPPPPMDTTSPPTYQKNRFKMSQSKSTFNLARQEDGELEKKKKSLGLKLKSSYSFRERDDLFDDHRRNSVESNDGSKHSRTYSDSSATGPPNGTRVVLGRETSPGPDLPHEVLSRFNGKTREDLIEMVVDLQAQLEANGRRVGDLEDYIDSLLLKVLQMAPILLKQPSPLLAKQDLRN